MAYYKVKPNEWVYPVKRGYKMACCDCGLVHIIDFDHIKCGRGRKIRLRARRDNRATANMRRGKCLSISQKQANGIRQEGRNSANTAEERIIKSVGKKEQSKKKGEK